MVESDIIIPPDMQEAITTFYDQCREIMDNISSVQEAKKTPAKIYHYTDRAGLLGILKSRKIRLTDIFDLNDTSELRHGLKQACETFIEEARGTRPPTTLLALRFKAAMDANVEMLARYFIACFSCDEDDLGQWRAYGENGEGFAIGFDEKLLCEAFVKVDADCPKYSNGTFQINYDDTMLRDLHRQLIKKLLPLISVSSGRKLKSDVANMFETELIKILSLSVIYASIGFKHEAYKNEREYRFLQIRAIDKPTDDLKHRLRGYSFIDYTDFDWNTKGPNSLREIIIGPAADGGAAHSFVRHCLIASGFNPDNVTVQQSKIPYRNM